MLNTVGKPLVPKLLAYLNVALMVKQIINKLNDMFGSNLWGVCGEIKLIDVG